MKKTIASCVALAALVAPTAASSHSNATHHRLHRAHGAVQACKAERKSDLTAFRQKYANKKGRHAFRRCVRQHAGDPIS